MTDFDNTNRGVLFRAKEVPSEKHPSYTGKLNVGGVDFRLSAWVKESKTGEKFFSLAISEKQEKPEPKKAGHFDDMADDLPF